MPILAWAVEYSVSANDQLGKLDRRISNPIVSYMEDGVARLENPRLRRQALTGNLRVCGVTGLGITVSSGIFRMKSCGSWWWK